MVFAYLAAFATAVFYGWSAVLEDTAAKGVPITGTSGKRAAVRAALQPMYVLGMLLSIVAWFLSLVALRHLPLFAVQAIASASIGIVALIVWNRTGLRPTDRQMWMLALLGVGLVALSVSAAPSEPKQMSWTFSLGMWLGVAAVTVAALFASRFHGALGSALLGTVSGLSDAGMALCARSFDQGSFSVILRDPVVWALVPFTLIGLVSFAGALQRGDASIALACQHALMTVVPAALGLMILGDGSRPGLGWLTAVGFVVTVTATIALTLNHAGDPDMLVTPAPEPVRR